MSEEPINPFYMYDNASKEYLEENLKRKTFEHQSYNLWAKKAEEEIRYIQERLREKNV